MQTPRECVPRCIFIHVNNHVCTHAHTHVLTDRIDVLKWSTRPDGLALLQEGIKVSHSDNVLYILQVSPLASHLTHAFKTPIIINIKSL